LLRLAPPDALAKCFLNGSFRGDRSHILRAVMATVAHGWFAAARVLSIALSVCVAAHAENWPAWRGPNGNGVASDKDLPLSWGEHENVRWRVPLPDRGNSTPIVWGHRIFVTQAVEKDRRRTLMCFSRSDGKLLWQSGVTYAERDPTNGQNPFCSASPVTDGRH